MHIRIELDDPADLEGSLKKLRSSLPKTVLNYFPYKKMVGAEWYGFNFIHEDRLFDWKSISTWCEVTSEVSAVDECCFLLVSVTPQKLLEVAAPLLIEMIRKGREVEYSIDFRTKKRDRILEVELSQANKQLIADFDFRNFPAKDTKAVEVLSQAWTEAQKHLPPLKDAKLEFGKGVTVRVEGATSKTCQLEARPNQLKVTYRGAALRNGLNGALKWAVQCGSLFDGTRNDLTLQLLPSDAAKISQLLSEAFGEQLAIYFDGMYRPDFHPDQVLKIFPPEGYWQLPMFAIQGGREVYQQIHFHLIQTPKERFIEAHIGGEKYLTKLKGKVEFQVYDGPSEKRWNLHKLRSKKN